jgi:hypothetical protein
MADMVKTFVQLIENIETIDKSIVGDAVKIA